MRAEKDLVGSRVMRSLLSVIHIPESIIHRLAILALLLVVLPAVFGFVSGGVARAQTRSQWSPQARIPDYEYEYSFERPLISHADTNRTVHVFNAQTLEDGTTKAVVYRHWTLEDGWTTLNDIILGDQAMMPLDLYVDRGHRVHLVMVLNGHIQYSSASLSEAGRAPAWSPIELIGEQASSPFYADLVGNDQGRLFVLYGGNEMGSGLYLVTSEDFGSTWTEPEPIFLVFGEDHVVMDIDTYLGAQGQLHVVWSVVDRSGIGVSGYYARLDTSPHGWTTPMELDLGGVFLGLRFPTVFEYGDDVIITYYNGEINGHYWRRSRDGGLTWSERQQLSPGYVGTNGPVSYAIDSNSILHLFFAKRTRGNDHGAWHMEWAGNGWTEPKAIVHGPRVTDVPNGQGFDPSHARGVIVNGNVVLVMWITDGGAGFNGAWYAHTILDTPELPAIPLPNTHVSAINAQLLPTPTVFSRASPSTSQPVATPGPQLPSMSEVDLAYSELHSPARPLLVGLTPIIVLVVMVVFLRRLQRRSSY